MTLPQQTRRIFRTLHNKTILHRILGTEAVYDQPKLCLGSSIRVNKNTSKVNHTKKDNFRVARKKNSTQLLNYCGALVQHQEPQTSGYEILSDCYGNRFIVPLEILASLQRIAPFSGPKTLPQPEVYGMAANFQAPQDRPFQDAGPQENCTFQNTVSKDPIFQNSNFEDPVLPFQHPLSVVNSMPMSHDMVEEEVNAPVISNDSNSSTPQEAQSQALLPVPQQEALSSQEVVCTITEEEPQVPQLVLDFMLFLEGFNSDAYFVEHVGPLAAGLESEESLETVSEAEPSTPGKTPAPTISTVCANIPLQTPPKAPGIKRSWTPHSEKLLQCKRQRVPTSWSQSEIEFLRQLTQNLRQPSKPSQAPPSPDWVAELEEELVAELKKEALRENNAKSAKTVKGGIDDDMLSLFGCMSIGDSLATPAVVIELPLVPSQ